MAAGGDGLAADDVLVTAGAAAALFCIATSLLEPGDHAVVVRTNYATNLETPRAIGADLDVVDLRFDDGWRLDVEQVAERVRDGETRLISVTQPHNPTGTMFDRATLDALVELAERSGAVLLVDETYRDLTHGEPLPAGGHAVAERRQRLVDVEGLRPARPAHRLGGLPRPGAGRAAAGRQGADAHLRRHPRRADRRHGAGRPGRPCCRRSSTTCARGSAIVRDVDGRRSRPSSGWSRPVAWSASCAFRPEVPVDTDRFYDVLLAEHGTYVGPGHWFELDDRHFRLGYGWPTRGRAARRAGRAHRGRGQPPSRRYRMILRTSRSTSGL